MGACFKDFSVSSSRSLCPCTLRTSVAASISLPLSPISAVLSERLSRQQKDVTRNGHARPKCFIEKECSRLGV